MTPTRWNSKSILGEISKYLRTSMCTQTRLFAGCGRLSVLGNTWIFRAEGVPLPPPSCPTLPQPRSRI
ncbi:hypothetical protein AYI68_g1817 [Smittium mucronatum]|uniref:Uncharacterized protein n=1 Tax=Smittium mucronatum TaxID=133383 RepID=A0A1R0H4B2_9FUNG|nr:hypothetical protein AYI68_g1817 [Smittium mucronatum]